MNIRNLFLEKGLFPETLPPCFDSSDLTRCFNGIISHLKDKSLHKKRDTDYIRYVGTKHDGNRRPYGTPNPISYFQICQFIEDYWNKEFTKTFANSLYSISTPRLGNKNEDRAIIVSSLSQLANNMSNKIRYAPFILKTDIAQFFPSIYTHSIPWVIHGKDNSKNDRRLDSQSIEFNKLDKFIQDSQNGQTRGILIGPDAFRAIAELISAKIDEELHNKVGDLIVGAVRHVDDFYIGVKSELDATVVLSALRDVLQSYELQINDHKTQILSGLEPINDVWAQNLHSIPLGRLSKNSNLDRLIDSAFETSKKLKSESPIKLTLRRLDEESFYRGASWKNIESKLQRIMYHFPHSIDYVCLLVVKRFAMHKEIDVRGWSEASSHIIARHLNFNHHHEIAWLLWMIFTCKLSVEERLITKLSTVDNSHIKALLIAAYCEQLCPYKLDFNLGNSLNTTDHNWLHNLVSKSLGFSKLSFSKELSSEFNHLASKNVKLLDFEKHLKYVSKSNSNAISKSKYGYDVEEDDEIEF